jgi:hypothetical protein
VRKPRIYAAHPVASYVSPGERAALRTLRELFRGAEIINPATRYQDCAHWRQTGRCSSSDPLVLFAGDDGTIGVGCVHEFGDAIRFAVPVVAPCIANSDS